MADKRTARLRELASENAELKAVIERLKAGYMDECDLVTQARTERDHALALLISIANRLPMEDDDE